MSKAAIVEIEIYTYEDMLEDSLNLLEDFLEEMTHRGLIRNAHVYFSIPAERLFENYGPLLTEMLQ